MSHPRSTFSIAVLCAAALAGCMVGPQYHAPPALPALPPASYKESSTQYPDQTGWQVAQPRDGMLRGKWWTVFDNPELNGLEDQLDINNQNIKVAFENFMAARSLIQQAASQLYPNVTVGPAFTRSQSPSQGGSSGGSAGTSSTSSGNKISNFYSIPFDVSWEPDLWGRVRSAVQEQQANAQLSAADLENERLTEQTDLAMLFFQIRGQDALQKLLDDTIVLDKKLVDYTRAQYDTGIGDQISLVQAENTLQSAQATATNLGVARAQFEHGIAVLVGKNPSQFSIPVKPAIFAPPPVPVGIPSQLLERRPDIAAAERQMAASNAQIGIESAAYYPALTLSAGAGFESSTLDTLLNWPSRFWSVGPSLTYTIFDAGLRRATLDQYIAEYNSAVAGYRQTVLTAFQQVEDNLSAVRLLSQQALQESQAVASAAQSVDLETDRYTTGVDPFINLVTVKNTLLSNQETLLSVQIQEMTSTVQLIAALGGGWNRSDLPTTQRVSEWPTADERAMQK
jgi:NodT family efflux transporter outer membrane factor (OMF) lipoprotein